MELARDFQVRLRRATTLGASLWISALALAAGAAMARLLVALAPASGGDVAAARALGIVSLSILADHSKSAEVLAYALALAGALTTSLVIWVTWATRAGRNGSLAPAPVPSTTPRATWLEIAIVVLLSFGLFARFWNGHAASFAPWTVLAEEGEMLAWVDTVLRGGALSRDVFCLYGPLSTWPIAILFSIFGPSLGLSRTWIFALNAPALIAIYFLLRGITRSKIAAGAGTIACALLCAYPIPAMSWSLARVGLGLAAFAALNRALDRGTIAWRIGTGALIGAALLYSQEIGVACALAVVVVLFLRPKERVIGILWTVLGTSLVLVPAMVYLAATNALGATLENLFLFPRVRMLGFGAAPFPRLDPTAASLRAYFVPAVLAVSAFATATKLLRGFRDARVFTELALFIFGALLFHPALSRPDDSHFTFVAPPALVLLTGMLEDACFALRSRNHRVAATAGLALGLAALAPWSAAPPQIFLSLIKPPSGHAIALPRGGRALAPEQLARDLENITHAIQSRTASNEPFWVFPNEALLYFLADRPQPTHFPLALFAVTRAQREQLVAELERTRPRWAVLYRGHLDVADGIPYPVVLPEVVPYLLANYEIEGNFGGFILLRRKS
jgi:hypothetical protein